MGLDHGAHLREPLFGRNALDQPGIEFCHPARNLFLPRRVSGAGGTTVSIGCSISSARSSAVSCMAAASTAFNDAVVLRSDGLALPSPFRPQCNAEPAVLGLDPARDACRSGHSTRVFTAPPRRRACRATSPATAVWRLTWPRHAPSNRGLLIWARPSACTRSSASSTPGGA